MLALLPLVLLLAADVDPPQPCLAAILDAFQPFDDTPPEFYFNDCDLNQPMPNGEFPLHRAISSNQMPLVKRMLAAGAKMKAVSEKQTSLTAAVDSQVPAMIAFVLSKGVTPAIKARDGTTALMRVADEASLKTILPLTLPADVDARDAEGKTALMYAASRKLPTVVQVLLAAKANPMIRSNVDRDAAWFAVKNQCTACFEALLSAGVDPSLGAERDTPLELLSSNVANDLLKKAPPGSLKGRDLYRMFSHALRNCSADRFDATLPHISAADAESADEPAIWHAARCADVRFVKGLIAKPVNVNPEMKKKSGQSPLWLALYQSKPSLPVVEALLAAGATPNAPDSAGRTPLSLAVRSKEVALVEALLSRKADPNVRIADMKGASALGAADSLPVMEALLRAGANVEHADDNGWTPIMLRAGNERARFDLLRAKGANLLLVSKDGWTPLMIAARSGYEDVVKELIKAGAPVNQQGTDGWTALSLAVFNLRLGVATVLLDAKANTDVIKKGNETLLILALKGVSPADAKKETTADPTVAMVSLLLDRGVAMAGLDEYAEGPIACALEFGKDAAARLLIERGAAVELPAETKERSSLCVALEKGKIDIAQSLVDKGAKVNGHSYPRLSNLACATAFGTPEAVAWALKNGANMNAVSPEGETALMSAAGRSECAIATAMVKTLLEKGARKDAKDKEGRTAVDLARSNYCKESTTLLEGKR